MKGNNINIETIRRTCNHMEPAVVELIDSGHPYSCIVCIVGFGFTQQSLFSMVYPTVAYKCKCTTLQYTTVGWVLDTALLHSSRPLNGETPNHQVQCLYDNDMYDNHQLIMMMRMQPNNNRETCTQKRPNRVQASQVNCKICLNQPVCMSFVVGFGWF